MEYSKYIVYVDESGDHEMQSTDSNYPVFVLAFCVFHKEYYSNTVVSEINKFKFKNIGHDLLILHESDIRREKGQFNFFNSKEQKNKFLDDLTNIIDTTNFILISSVIKKTIIKDSDIKNIHPYNLALKFCLETLYEFLQEKNQEKYLTHIVLECRGKKEDNELELEFRRICDGENRFNIKLPFKAIFADKKVNSVGLQFSDLVVRPIGLSVIRPEQNNRAFDVLTKKFYCSGGRTKAGKCFENFGLKIYPLKSEKP